jgi:TolA-binding protein
VTSRLLFALLLTAGPLGCATTGDVERLSARVDVLEDERDQMRAKMTEDMARLEKLHAMLKEAEDNLRKNGADLGLRLERIEQELPKLRGSGESLEFRMNQADRDLGTIKKELAERLGLSGIFLPPNLPKDKDGLWAAAEASARAERTMEAKAIFELYEANFPEDLRAPQALVEIGKLLEKAGDLDGAIKHYQMVYERHEGSPLAATATFRIAELFVIQQNCDRAKAIFDFVQKQFKSSPEAAEAKARVKTVANECKKPR